MLEPNSSLWVEFQSKSKLKLQLYTHKPSPTQKGKQTETAWQQLEIWARLTRVKRPDPQADGLREASVDTVGVGGKYEAGQKRVKARSMYFLKAAGAAEKQRSGNQCAANTEITEVGVSQASSREAGTGVGQVADRKATAKQQPSNSQAWESGHRRSRSRAYPCLCNEKLLAEVGSQNRKEKNCCTTADDQFLLRSALFFVFLFF